MVAASAGTKGRPRNHTSRGQAQRKAVWRATITG